ncbi:MAG: HAMP domain-containing sensor histidine kinase [Bacteroidota bacterium]
MTNRLRLVVLFTVMSLVGVFCLQVYYGWQVYQEHAATLERQVDIALREAVAVAEKDRVRRINVRFAADIRNPCFAELSLCPRDGRLVVCVSDPNNQDLRATFPFAGTLDSSATQEELVQQVVRQNSSSIAEGAVIYWTDTIGVRLTAYKDSIGVIPTYLCEQLNVALAARRIDADFRLVFSMDSTISLPPEEAGALLSAAVPANFTEDRVVAAVVRQPGQISLRRFGPTLALTVVVLLAVIFSFGVLLYLLNRQKQLGQLKDDFIDNVTHELMTPVTTLRLALDTLRSEEENQSAQRYLPVMEQQTHRIAEVVDHILQISFVDEQKPGLNLERLRPATLLEEVLAYHRGTTQKPLRIAYAAGNAAEVWSDRRHLVNVFHNLISNAIKYTPAGGAELSVRFREEEQSLFVLITDNGCGIPPGERERIFEKFHRVSTGGTHEVKGLGIGLYYARSILRQLHGDLCLLGSNTAGSTFAVVLPKGKNG